MKTTGRPRSFNDLLDGQTPNVQAVAKRLRGIVRAAAPDVEERVFGGSKVMIAAYHLDDPDNAVCSIQPGGDICRLFVQHVLKLEDVPFKLEGKGGGNRHVKFARVADLDEPALRRVIAEAAEIARG
ncbi:MAG: DUF1801 domain-containing protein [Planctomycetota bacterium]